MILHICDCCCSTIEGCELEKSKTIQYKGREYLLCKKCQKERLKLHGEADKKFFNQYCHGSFELSIRDAKPMPYKPDVNDIPDIKEVLNELDLNRSISFCNCCDNRGIACINCTTEEGIYNKPSNYKPKDPE